MAGELSTFDRNVAVRHVRLIDENGNLCAVDAEGGGALGVQNVFITQTNAGKAYSTDAINLALVDAASLNCLIRIPQGYETHMGFKARLGGDMRIRLFEDPVTTADGSAATVINRHRRFKDVAAKTLMFGGPTISNDGVLIMDQIEPGGSGTSQFTQGGRGGEDQKFVMTAGDYLFRLENISGSTQPASLQLVFYEVQLPS